MCMALVIVNGLPNVRLSVVTVACRLLTPAFKLFGNDSRDESFGVDVLPTLWNRYIFYFFFKISNVSAKCYVLELFDDKLPFSNGSSLHGISQPRQNFDHGHSAHTRPPSLTALSVNGNSYPKLSSL